MLETFYVYSGKEDNYQLRLVKNHWTMSTSSSLEGILECLARMIVRYKSKTTFEKRLRGIEKPKVSETTQRMKEQEYLESGDKYEEEVRRVVVANLKKVKEENTPKLIGADTIKIIPKKKKEETKTKIRPKKTGKKKIGLITL